MRARIGAITAILVTTLLAGLIVIPTASSQSVMHLVLPGHTQKVRLIDHRENGLRLGDRAAARGPLTDTEGTRVGTAYADCVVHRHMMGPDRGLWTCTYILDLGEGDLTVKGLDPQGSGEYEMAVLGGTGAYAEASGDATFTDSLEEPYIFGQTDMVIRLSK